MPPSGGLGWGEAVWGSRRAQPAQPRWSAAGSSPRLEALENATAEAAPPALACAGLLVRGSPPAADQRLRRLVAGRPVSAVPLACRAWCRERLAAPGLTALFLLWAPASWPTRQAVRPWLRQHKQRVKATGHGVRIVACRWPVPSPGRTLIAPPGGQGKRAVAEADRRLRAQELASRVCADYGCDPEAHLVVPEKGA